MDGAETTSLTDLRIPSGGSNGNDDSRSKIMTSASMGDINEVDSGRLVTYWIKTYS